MYLRLKKESASDLMRLSPFIPVYTPVSNGNGSVFKETKLKYLCDYYLDDNSTKMFISCFGAGPERLFQASQCLEKMTEPDFIKPWYLMAFPSDELGVRIRPDLTFNDFLVGILNHEDPYKILNVWDSAVRSRVFAEVSVRTGFPLENLQAIYMSA